MHIPQALSLDQISVTLCLTSSVNTSSLLLSISISFVLFKLWLLRIFVFPGCTLSPTFPVQSHNIFWSCFVEAKRSTWSAKRRLVRQSWSLSPKQMPIPFFICHRGRSSHKPTCRTLLKSKLDSGSPCLVPFLISNMSLSLFVITVFFLAFEKSFQKV